MKLLPPVYPWQQWPRGYEPTLKELEVMTDDEYEDYWADTSRYEIRRMEKELGVRLDTGLSDAEELARSKKNHPTNPTVV